MITAEGQLKRTTHFLTGAGAGASDAGTGTTGGGVGWLEKRVIFKGSKVIAGAAGATGAFEFVVDVGVDFGAAFLAAPGAGTLSF